MTNHSSLADKALRYYSMNGTDFHTPVEGTMKSIKRIKSQHLVKKLNYFNKNVLKKVYIRGKKDVLKISKILTNECGWSEKGKFQRVAKKDQKFKKLKKKIILVPVPNANQAQIRLGRFLPLSKIQNDDLLILSSSYLGGGFISVLNQEIRVKRGLTYSIGATARSQKYYGRSTIMTFSRNDKVSETISIIKEILGKAQNEIDGEGLHSVRNYLKVSF